MADGGAAARRVAKRRGDQAKPVGRDGTVGHRGRERGAFADPKLRTRDAAVLEPHAITFTPNEGFIADYAKDPTEALSRIPDHLQGAAIRAMQHGVGIILDQPLEFGKVSRLRGEEPGLPPLARPEAAGISSVEAGPGAILVHVHDASVSDEEATRIAREAAVHMGHDGKAPVVIRRPGQA